ncbi:MAG: hypothetical protein IJ863_06980, partial [Spirochaetales bacterium]|nr:hypothetical protein [Spirochaetales bacterium]
MRQFSKKAFVFILVLLFLTAILFAQSVSEVRHGEHYGKTVILHSNDVHGAIDGYAKIAALRDAYEAEGAEVIMIDNGDYLQGSIYVNIGKGANAVTMMDLAGYDYAGIGNHEFDYGYRNLLELIDGAAFRVFCADVFDEDGNPILNPYVIHRTEQGADLGIFFLTTPQTQTKVRPSLVSGLSFPSGDDLYAVAQYVVDELDSMGVDLVVCVAHLGVDSEAAPNRSTDLMENVDGIDFLIDGHSHSVFSGYEGYGMQQTGTGFQNIGVVEIDSATGEILDYYLVPCEGLAEDETLAAKAAGIKSDVDSVYSVRF